MAESNESLVDKLNRCMPIAKEVGLGDILHEIITKQNALLQKLDADVGVTDVNYASTLGLDELKDRVTSAR